MRIVILIIALIAGYIVYDQHESEARQNAFNTLIETIDEQPLNQFEIKSTLFTQVSARCETVSIEDEERAKECLNLVSSYKNECDKKVFRLAPIEFSDSENLMVYSERYQKCLFSKEYAYLIEDTNLL